MPRVRETRPYFLDVPSADGAGALAVDVQPDAALCRLVVVGLSGQPFSVQGYSRAEAAAGQAVPAAGPLPGQTGTAPAALFAVTPEFVADGDGVATFFTASGGYGLGGQGQIDRPRQQLHLAVRGTGAFAALLAFEVE